MRIYLSLLSLLVGMILLSSCATTQPKFHVYVDSISDSSVDKKSYILLPGNKDTKADDLQFKEYASYVNRSLIKHGFVPVKSFENANVAIFLVYGIGDPQEKQYSYSLPVWGQTGISSSTTYGTSNTYGSLNTYGNYGTYSGNTSSSSTTTYNPTYGIKGYTSHTGTMVTYFRFMILEAIDLDEYKSTKKEVQLWKTTVTSSGSSGDLREVFPILVAASSPYISINTGKQIKVIISENDERVLEIKAISKARLIIK